MIMTKVKFRCMQGKHSILVDREECSEFETKNNRTMLTAVCPEHGSKVYKIPKKSEL